MENGERRTGEQGLNLYSNSPRGLPDMDSVLLVHLLVSERYLTNRNI